jgi:hypothetical protein
MSKAWAVARAPFGLRWQSRLRAGTPLWIACQTRRIHSAVATSLCRLTPINPDGAKAALFRANIPESLQISLRGNVAKARPLVAGNDLFDKLNCRFGVPVVLMPICESIENAERSG